MARLKAEGPNTLRRPNRRIYGRITLEILREPTFALLLAAAAIYLVLSDLTEAIVLAVFASTSVLIAVAQEVRAERVLESLRDLTSLRALVIRDGAEKRIAGTEVVRGDLVILAEGDRVPADAMVLSQTARAIASQADIGTGEIVTGSATRPRYRRGVGPRRRRAVAARGSKEGFDPVRSTSFSPRDTGWFVHGAR